MKKQNIRSNRINSNHSINRNNSMPYGIGTQ